ncbi:NAD(P)-dependent dehydrogenase, short-chain alcohol dehydrogenase family [Mucilaginibacter gossypiicola]|uniref:NAD(P)-dependent dehydrogenase, short-chain alcohol dehydrogenase family n=1 Tax=Mucilaginibacter gossypiicola TaxID=551995 RepID=A0A1H8NRL8_9SPHI|nr:oxidoreductase [Mucilaginibacter gossypiicola]SEO31978.1 NAD(P)-dependent dehydrogenase, short-chain alcohol dehydrogenase family [Mucilaginibacter gossypiicola]
MWITSDIPDQSGKTVIITGANTGIGFEAAKALYNRGAYVIMACRNIDKAQAALSEIKTGSGPGEVELAFLDLASLKSVSEFASTIKNRVSNIDVLINNAGVMTPPKGFTAEGFESQFGINHLGHFALTGHLYPLIRKTPGARIITVTSLAYLYGDINFHNLKCENPYDAFREYCQSKLANISFALELQRRILKKGDKVYSIAAHPGVTKTSIGRHMSDSELEAASQRFGEFMEASQGVLPILYAAVASGVKEGGFYGPDADGGLRGYPSPAAVQENAVNQSTATELWNISQEAANIIFP